MKALSFNRNFYFEFSNFYEAPVAWRGITWRNAECAFQCAKACDDEFGYHAEMIRDLIGAKAKSYGRTAISLRTDWEQIKHDVMLKVVRAKFQQNDELAELLKSTGDQFIIEDTTAWHDNTFGRCSCPKCVMQTAENSLGNILMLVRAELRGEDSCFVSFEDYREEIYRVNLLDKESVNAVVDKMHASSWFSVIRSII